MPFQLDDRLLLHFSWHTFPVAALVARQNWKIIHLKWTIEKIVENRRNREKGKFRNACGTPRPKGAAGRHGSVLVWRLNLNAANKVVSELPLAMIRSGDLELDVTP